MIIYDFISRHMSKKQKIYFLTYGDSRKYKTSTKHLISLAKESGFFEKQISMSKKDLDTDFKKKYSDILSQNRGGGYWLWKHKIIENLLNEVNDNDIVFYTDAGSSFNYFGQRKFYEYIDILNSSNFDNLRFEIGENFIEKYWTSKEIFNYFNIDLNNNLANTPQLVGGHLFFIKSKDTFDFFNEFKNTITFDPYLITDKYNTNQINGFIENRHDQSILSLLSKKFGGEILKSQTYFNEDPSLQYEYPILSVRNYGHGLKDRLRFFFNINGYKKKPKYFKNI